VKGLPGPAEAAGGPALSGRDGEAVCKALQKLGHDPALVFFTLTRPQANMAPEARARRVRLQLEAVDAPLVIALDRPAAEDIAEAFSMPQLPSGAEVRACGRRFVACDGLESALDDDRAKRAVWRQLSAAVLQPPAF
ncbi:MAG TPA: hypothetical protein VLA05_09905, partial [Coriobacteriia bacterium]|nr:hypothetical protein [Coriobacteriia bacterium]